MIKLKCHFEARGKTNLYEKNFFNKGQKSIDMDNLNILHIISIFTFLALIFFILITPLLIPGWRPTIHYILFIPAISIITALAAYAKFKGTTCHKTILHLCAAYEVISMGFLMVIDIFPYPNYPASFTPFFIVISSMIFIFPKNIVLPFLWISGIIFSIMCFMFKDPFIAHHDIFVVLSALLSSMILFSIVQYIRIRNYLMREKLTVLSFQDTLTNLLNKRTCSERINIYLQNKPDSSACAMIMMDLDDFKKINDTFGHKKGDDILIRVGAAIRLNLTSSDIAGRFGGDEFLIFMDLSSDTSRLKNICCKIEKDIKSILKAEIGLCSSCSMGIAYLESGSSTYDDMFEVADKALYNAKASGKSISFTVDM